MCRGELDSRQGHPWVSSFEGLHLGAGLAEPQLFQDEIEAADEMNGLIFMLTQA